MDLPVPPLSEITYAAVQRHRAHVYQTMRDASKLQPVDFVSMFDAGAFAKDKKKANTESGKGTTIGNFSEVTNQNTTHRKHAGKLAPPQGLK